MFFSWLNQIYMRLCVWCLKDKMRLLNKRRTKSNLYICIFKKPALANETCAYGKHYTGCVLFLAIFDTFIVIVIVWLCMLRRRRIIIWFLLSMCEWCEWFRSAKNTCKNFADAHTHAAAAANHMLIQQTLHSDDIDFCYLLMHSRLLLLSTIFECWYFFATFLWSIWTETSSTVSGSIDLGEGERISRK